MTTEHMIKAASKGRREEDPGKMKYRFKGVFMSKDVARAHQKDCSIRGIRAKVMYFPEDAYPYHLYVLALHDFWKKNFIINTRTSAMGRKK